MRIVYNKYLPPKNFLAINLFGYCFCRHGAFISQRVLRHESIHTAQMRELGYVFFYLLYVVEWVTRLPMKGKAYWNISFEREAYANDANPSYLATRKPYAWLSYLRKSA